MGEPRCEPTAPVDEIDHEQPGGGTAPCLACPADCGSCSRDETNCECYEHEHLDNDSPEERAVVERSTYPAAAVRAVADDTEEAPRG